MLPKCLKMNLGKSKQCGICCSCKVSSFEFIKHSHSFAKKTPTPKKRPQNQTQPPPNPPTNQISPHLPQCHLHGDHMLVHVEVKFLVVFCLNMVNFFHLSLRISGLKNIPQ